VGINDAGTATGWLQDSGQYISFVRSSDGKLKTFSAPTARAKRKPLGHQHSARLSARFTIAVVKGTAFCAPLTERSRRSIIRAPAGRRYGAINDKGAIAGSYGTNDGTFGFAGKP